MLGPRILGLHWVAHSCGEPPPLATQALMHSLRVGETSGEGVSFGVGVGQVSTTRGWLLKDRHLLFGQSWQANLGADVMVGFGLASVAANLM